MFLLITYNGAKNRRARQRCVAYQASRNPQWLFGCFETQEVEVGRQTLQKVEFVDYV